MTEIITPPQHAIDIAAAILRRKFGDYPIYWPNRPTAAIADVNPAARHRPHDTPARAAG